MESWEKLRFLGGGSYGKVFLACPSDSDDDRVMAVKSAKVDDRSRCDSLEAEASFLELLKGEPYVVGCFGEDWSTENGQSTYNLLLEYATGGTLTDLISSSRRMYASRVAYFTRMLLTGLSRIHSHGIVHCDLKPDNILVFRTCGHPQLKIADFGLARMVSEREESEVWNEKYWNRGTTIYASPESVARGEHGTCTDIWSLGIIVAEMMTGTYFWDLEKDLYDQIVYQPLELEDRVPGHFDEDGQDFLAKCLDRDPRNRWSAQALLNHPFITGNLNGSSRYSFVGLHNQSIKAQNPIAGSSEWVASSDLFTHKTDDVVYCS